MNNFKQLDLQSFNILPAIEKLIAEGKLEWTVHDQICINTVPGNDDPYYGCGSLFYEWYTDPSDNPDPNMKQKFRTRRRQIDVEEFDFSQLCSVFKGTEVETFYNYITSIYPNESLGRIRIIRSMPRTCLSWHQDQTPRIHHVLETYEGCNMVIDNEVCHMPEGTWWWTDTTKKHTAFNGSKDTRTHIVIAYKGSL